MKIRTTILALSLHLVGSTQLAAAETEAYLIAAGQSEKINAHGACRVIENGGEYDIMVPVKSDLEWATGEYAFLNAISTMDRVFSSNCVLRTPGLTGGFGYASQAYHNTSWNAATMDNLHKFFGLSDWGSEPFDDCMAACNSKTLLAFMIKAGNHTMLNLTPSQASGASVYHYHYGQMPPHCSVTAGHGLTKNARSTDFERWVGTDHYIDVSNYNLAVPPADFGRWSTDHDGLEMFWPIGFSPNDWNRVWAGDFYQWWLEPAGLEMPEGQTKCYVMAVAPPNYYTHDPNRYNASGRLTYVGLNPGVAHMWFFWN